MYHIPQQEFPSEEIFENLMKRKLISFCDLPTRMQTKEYYEKIVEHDGIQWEFGREDFNSQELFQKALMDYPNLFYFARTENQCYLTIENLKIALENPKIKKNMFHCILEYFPQKEFDKISDEEGIRLCIKARLIDEKNEYFMPSRYMKTLARKAREAYWAQEDIVQFKESLRKSYQVKNNTTEPTL